MRAPAPSSAFTTSSVAGSGTCSSTPGSSIDGRPPTRRSALRGWRTGRSSLAVPPGVAHLLAEEPVHDGADVFAEVGPDCYGLAVDARLDLAREKGLAGVSHLLFSRTRATARRAPALTGSRTKSRNSITVQVVEVHSGKRAPGGIGTSQAAPKTRILSPSGTGLAVDSAGDGAGVARRPERPCVSWFTSIPRSGGQGFCVR